MKIFVLFFLLFFSTWSFGQRQLELFFDFNDENPNQHSIQILKDWCIDRNNEVIKIESFCDSTDTKEYNKSLAEKRIESVLKILKNNHTKSTINIYLYT